MSSTARGLASARARSSISAIFRGWSRREKISVVRRSGVSSVLREEPGGAGVLHGGGIARLVGVGGGAEGDEDGGASGGGNFRHGDRARAADDQVCLGKALRHILDKGNDLRVEFAPRICVSHRIIVTFSGLMHDEKLIFSHRETSSDVDYRPIDGHERRGCLR